MRLLLISLCLACVTIIHGQTNVDTLAFQDFEVVPATPTWTFTGPVLYNSGISGTNAAPPSSPIGIGGSRAWETTLNSGGLVLDFANVTVPTLYDSVRVSFKLAAFNLSGPSGGPDHLDYVLVEYSLDNGVTYTGRLRIRGAVNNNSFWAYNATGQAHVYYLPSTETMFQPVNTGLATTLGYSSCQITFPGTVTQVKIRLTGRSSSSTDTWMIDNVLLTGENVCSPTTHTFSTQACGSYTSPSGQVFTTSGTYQDTILNSTGCDSILTINLNLSQPSASTVNVSACNSFTSPSGHVWTSSGTYQDTLINTANCDSVITFNLTVNTNSSSTVTTTACNAFLSPSGNNWTTSGIYQDTIPNAAGCDSVMTFNLTVNYSSNFTLFDTACSVYISPSGNQHFASGAFVDIIPNAAGCDSTIVVNLYIPSINAGFTQNGNTLTAMVTGTAYQWVDCGNNFAAIPGATGMSYTATQTGSYAVVIYDGLCSDTSACGSIVVALDGQSPAAAQIFPNPVQNQLNLSVPAALLGQPWAIYGTDGRRILEGQAGAAEVEISLRALAQGAYILQLGEQRMRFVKE